MSRAEAFPDLLLGSLLAGDARNQTCDLLYAGQGCIDHSGHGGNIVEQPPAEYTLELEALTLNGVVKAG